MGSSTCFPVSMSRGATWDVAIEERVGQAIGLEGRAQGANYFAGICINLPRHPAWGRIQETYSEDPLLLGKFGTALHRGVRNHMMTCVKHFALNSMENARFRVDVKVDDAALHEVYLPHFKSLIDAGVSSVMSSYNSVRGEFVGQNQELLTGILRDQWNFDGIVLSDFIFGLRDPVLSVKNGLDIEAPFAQQRDMYLKQALDNGQLTWPEVNTACKRILRKQIDHVARTGLSVPSKSVVCSKAHLQLAREAAARGMVLLKNNEVSGSPLLPIQPHRVRKIAIIGRLANLPNTGDRGSSAVYGPHVVTPYQGIKAAFPDAEVILEGSDSPEQAEEIASSVDLVLCVVGYDAMDEGEYVVPSFESDPDLVDLLPPPQNDDERETERIVKGEEGVPKSESLVAEEGIVPGAGGDRKSLRLRAQDVDIIAAVGRANPRFIVSVVAAGAIIMEDWIDHAPAVLMAWYSGAEGGHALADVLLGRTDASGRLPFSIPRSEDHLPHFDMEAFSIQYDKWFGQRLLDKLHQPARFSLGYGLSYTTFETTGLSVDTKALGFLDDFSVAATVRNTGNRPGRHIAQVYGVVSADDFPTRVLLGFQAVDLEADQARQVQIPCSIKPVRRWRDGTWELASRNVTIELANWSGHDDCLRQTIEL